MNPPLPNIHEINLSDASGEFFRVSAAMPAKAISACIFVNSGRVTKFDSELPEVALFQGVRTHLYRLGIATFEMDLPTREEITPAASTAHICQRLQRLEQLLGHNVFEAFTTNFTLVGLSLGGQVLLRFAGKKGSVCPIPHTLILISTIVDRPTPIFADSNNIYLIYGSRDHIAYIHKDTQYVVPISPKQYSEESVRNLIIRKSQTITVEILNGLGHVLNSITEEPENPVVWLSQLIAGINLKRIEQEQEQAISIGTFHAGY